MWYDGQHFVVENCFVLILVLILGFELLNILGYVSFSVREGLKAVPAPAPAKVVAAVAAGAGGGGCKCGIVEEGVHIEKT